MYKRKMVLETRNFAQQKGTSEREPFNAPKINQLEGHVQTTPNMGELVALQSENIDSNEQFRE